VYAKTAEATMNKIPDSYTSALAGSDQVLKKDKKDKKQRAANVAQQEKTGSKDAVDISGKGQEINHARQLAFAAPEVRQGLIDELVGQLEQGQYDIQGSDVAPKMIREHLMDWTE
jgi:flagellar biosynthesis anti-sigma factor FlgM